MAKASFLPQLKWDANGVGDGQGLEIQPPSDSRDRNATVDAISSSESSVYCLADGASDQSALFGVHYSCYTKAVIGFGSAAQMDGLVRVCATAGIGQSTSGSSVTPACGAAMYPVGNFLQVAGILAVRLAILTGITTL